MTKTRDQQIEALAREMWEADWDETPTCCWEQEHDKGRSVYLNLADIAMRHIEAARAEERERVAEWMIARSYATGHGDAIEALLWELEGQAKDRAGSPAPASPVMWTDDRIAAVRFLLNKADELAHTLSGQDAEKVHLILHNALGLLSTESEIRSASERDMRAALESASREGK